MRITTASSTAPDDQALIEFARSHGISEGVLKLISGTAAPSNPDPRSPLDVATPTAIQTAGLKPKAAALPIAPADDTKPTTAPEALPGSSAAMQLAPAQAVATGAATAKALSLTHTTDKQGAAQPDSTAVSGSAGYAALPAAAAAAAPTSVSAAPGETNAQAINLALAPLTPTEPSALEAESMPAEVSGDPPVALPALAKVAASAATVAQPRAVAANSASLFMMPAASVPVPTRPAPVELNGTPTAGARSGAASTVQRQAPLPAALAVAANSPALAPELAAHPLTPTAGDTAAIAPAALAFAHANPVDAVDAIPVPQQHQTALQTALAAETDNNTLAPQTAANPPAPPVIDNAAVQSGMLQMNQPERLTALRARKEPTAPLDQLNETVAKATDVAIAATDMTHPTANYAATRVLHQQGATAGQPQAETLQESYFRNVEQTQLLSARLGDAVGERMAVMIGRGIWQFDLQLNPAHLGRVDIRLAMSGSGKLDADIKTSSQQTADLLLGGQSRLKETLRQSGFDLTQINVEQDSNFAQSGQPQSDRQPSPSRGNATLASPTSSAPAEPQAGYHNGPANPIGLDRLDVTV